MNMQIFRWIELIVPEKTAGKSIFRGKNLSFYKIEN